MIMIHNALNQNAVYSFILINEAFVFDTKCLSVDTT